jgi:hypothetical protein
MGRIFDGRKHRENLKQKQNPADRSAFFPHHRSSEGSASYGWPLSAKCSPARIDTRSRRQAGRDPLSMRSDDCPRGQGWVDRLLKPKRGSVDIALASKPLNFAGPASFPAVVPGGNPLGDGALFSAFESESSGDELIEWHAGLQVPDKTQASRQSPDPKRSIDWQP